MEAIIHPTMVGIIRELIQSALETEKGLLTTPREKDALRNHSLHIKYSNELKPI